MMYMFTRAANDASGIQKFLMDTNKTSNASLLLLTSLPFPEITVPRERFLPSMRQRNHETLIPYMKVPNSQDNLGACRQSSSLLSAMAVLSTEPCPKY